jgi:hypothetical protein
MDGHSLTQSPGVDTAFAMYKISYYSYWLSAQNWYGAPAGNQCGKEVKISKEECINVFTEAMENCDPNSGTTAGASFQGECVSYVNHPSKTRRSNITDNHAEYHTFLGYRSSKSAMEHVTSSGKWGL